MTFTPSRGACPARQPADFRHFGPGFGCLFGFMFLGCGTLFFVLILGALATGDPNGSLQGSYPWKYLWALFPLPFMLVGAGVLLALWVNRKSWGQSPERLLAASTTDKSPRAVEGAVWASCVVARTDYPTITKPSITRGLVCATRLSASSSPVVAVVGLAVATLLCSGVLTPFLAYNAGSLLKLSMSEDSGGLFCTAVIAVFWGALVVALVKQVMQLRVPLPLVEVSEQPVYPGGSYELAVVQPGPVRVDTLRVLLVCEEEATYRQGTDTHKEKRLVHSEVLARRDDIHLEKRMSSTIRQSFQVPKEAMHSFEAVHNAISWKVRVQGMGGRWGNWEHDYSLVVYPPRNEGDRP